ncbi:MAG: dihydroneopterin aldolase [Bradyrhizobiaceae bacterium]|nr:MAG: dihydroneopterin aldolase [Bradyrhizobiaceae bacterium]
MTLFLASVTDPAEGEIAAAHGADIVDLTCSTRGAFGAVAPELVCATIAAVAGRRPVSAVAGEPSMDPDTVVAAATRIAEAGADYVKIALCDAPGREGRIRALSPLSARTRLVGVMFADAGFDESLLALLAESGFSGAMLDTAGERGGRLVDRLDIAALAGFVEACRARALMAWLAGSLEPPDVSRLLLIAPDVLGFRGALCAGGDRAARIDPAAVDIVRALIPADARRGPEAARPPAGVDRRLTAARAHPADPPRRETATDRIFVHDFTCPVRIGAYTRERAKPQQVRFNVDVKVLRPDHAPEDMRDVFSYDIIKDTICMIVNREHIPLVETLAERIAAAILAQPRVVSATVRVEKLEAGPGTVGVEIRRERPVEIAQPHQLTLPADDPRAVD